LVEKQKKISDLNLFLFFGNEDVFTGIKRNIITALDHDE